MFCPKCNSSNVVKNGKDKRAHYTLQRYLCKDCKKIFCDNTVRIDAYEEVGKRQIIDEENGNERICIVKGFDIPDTYEAAIKLWEVDLTVWKVDRVKFNRWGNPKNPSKQCTLKLSKIIPDHQKIPTIKKIEYPKDVNRKRQDFPVDPNEKSKRSVVLGDAQIGFRKDPMTGELDPFHDRKAMDLTLNLLEYIQPNEIIILGDMLDMTEAGTFRKDAEFYFTVQPAILEYAFFLENIRKICPHADIIYLKGNHENRLYNHAMENMAFAYTIKNPKNNLSIMSMRNLLSLDELDIKYIDEYPGGEYWINDRLRVIHGNSTKIETELNNSKVSTIMGHLHSIKKVFKTSHGRHGIEKMFVHIIGCLCLLDGSVPGKQQPNWQQGIALVNTVNEKYFDTTDIVFHSGKAIYNNILFEGEDYKEVAEKLFNKTMKESNAQ